MKAVIWTYQVLSHAEYFEKTQVLALKIIAHFYVALFVAWFYL